MTKRIVFAGLLISIIATPVAAQTKAEEQSKAEGQSKAEEPKEVIWEDGGVDFMDKRSPEDRDPCAKGFVQSGGDTKVFKDEGGTGAEKGGTADINIKCDDPRRVIWDDSGID